MKLLLPLLLPLADAKFSLRRSSGAVSVRKLYNMDYVNNIATSVQFSACVTIKTNSAVAQQLNADVYEAIQSGNYDVTQQVEGEDQVDGEGNVQEGNVEESALDAVYSVQNYAVFNRALRSYNGSDVSNAADLHMTSLDNYVLSLGELGEDKDTAAKEICEVCNSWGQLSYNYCSKGYKVEDEWENEMQYEEAEMQVTAQYNSMPLDCDTCYQYECWDIEDNTQQQQNEDDDQELTDDAYILEWVAEVGGCVESGYEVSDFVEMDGGDDDYSDYSALYLGWMCNEEGTGIQLAAYRDEDCTLYYPRVSAANLTDMDYEMFEKVQEVLPRALSTSQSCGTPPDYILPDGKVVTADWDGDGNSYYNTEEPQESAFCMALYGQTENGYYEDQDQDYVSIRMSTCGVYTAYAGDEDVQEAEADGYEGYEDQVEAGVFSSFNMATSFEEMMAAYNATYDGQQNDNENDGQQNDDAEYQGPEQYEACQFLNTQDIASTIAYNPYLSNSDNPDAQNPYEIDYSDPAYISNYTWGEDSNFDHSLYPFENGDDYESPTATATGSVLASSLETGGKIALIVIAVAASIIACTLILGIGKKSNSEDKKSPLLGETAVPKAPSGPIQEVVRSVSTISKATVQSIRNFAEAEKLEEEPVPDSVSAPVPELESAPVSAFEAVPAVTSVQSAATAPSLVVTVPVPVPAVPVPDPEAASVPVPVSAPVPEPEPAVEKKKPYKRPFLAKVSKSLFGKRKNTTK